MDLVDNEPWRASFDLTRADRIALGRRIGAVIKQRQLSQAAVAKFVGVSQMTVSRWSRGIDVPSALNLSMLSQVLGVTQEFLMKGHVREQSWIAALARARAPGQFIPEEEERSLRAAKAAARKAAETGTARIAERKTNAKLRAAQEREAMLARRPETIDKQREAAQAWWRWRRAIETLPKCCMVCGTPLRFVGICSICTNREPA